MSAGAGRRRCRRRRRRWRALAARRLARRGAARRLAQLRAAAGRRRCRLALVHSISLPPGVYGGDAIERLFINRLDWDAHPYFRPHPRPGGVVALRAPARRRGCCSSSAATSAPGMPAARAGAAARSCNDYAVGIELEGLEGEHVRGRAVRGAGRAARRAEMRAIRSKAWPATSMWRRAASTTPGRASTGRACDGRRAGRGGIFPSAIGLPGAARGRPPRTASAAGDRRTRTKTTPGDGLSERLPKRLHASARNPAPVARTLQLVFWAKGSTLPVVYPAPAPST